MSNNVSKLFNFADKIQVESMQQRLKRHQVLSSNIVNSETPGYRALGYDFEEQLQAIANEDGPLALKTTDPKHFKNAFTGADGSLSPDVYVVPTETITEDGNTVDVDREMTKLAENQILYRSAVEIINRKIGMLKYAINGGR